MPKRRGRPPKSASVAASPAGAVEKEVVVVAVAGAGRGRKRPSEGVPEAKVSKQQPKDDGGKRAIALQR